MHIYMESEKIDINDLIYKAENRDSVKNKCIDTKGEGQIELGDWDCRIYTTDTMYKVDD